MLLSNIRVCWSHVFILMYISTGWRCLLHRGLQTLLMVPVSFIPQDNWDIVLDSYRIIDTYQYAVFHVSVFIVSVTFLPIFQLNGRKSRGRRSLPSAESVQRLSRPGSSPDAAPPKKVRHVAARPSALRRTVLPRHACFSYQPQR